MFTGLFAFVISQSLKQTTTLNPGS